MLAVHAGRARVSHRRVIVASGDHVGPVYLCRYQVASSHNSIVNSLWAKCLCVDLQRPTISAGAVLSDGLALHAVLGAGDRDGGTCGIAQAGKGGCVGDFASSTVPEGDVLDRKWDGEFGVLRTWFGEFAHTEQVVKGDVGEVGDGLLFEGGEGAVGVSPAVAEDALDDGDGDGQLGLMGWVLELEILECPF